MGRHLRAKMVSTAIALGVAATGAQADQWNLPTGYPADNFHTRNIEMFAEDVRASTGGAVDITVYPDQSLLPLSAIAGAVTSGEVPIGEFLLSLLATQDPVFGVDSLPFLATGYDQAALLWQASRPEIERLLAEQNLKLLFSVPWPPQAIYTDVPINSLDDLAGLRIRTYNAETTRLVALVGGVPTEIDASDIAAALARGDLDAIITSSSTGVDEEVWRYLHYYYDFRAWLPRNVVVVNQDVFAALPAEQQTAIIAAAATAEQRGVQMSMDENAQQLGVLAEHGVVIVTPPAELVSALRAVGETMTTEWVDTASAAGATILRDFSANLP